MGEENKTVIHGRNKHGGPNKVALVRTKFPARARRAMRFAREYFRAMEHSNFVPGECKEVYEKDLGDFLFVFDYSFCYGEVWYIAEMHLCVVMRQSDLGGSLSPLYDIGVKPWRVSTLETKMWEDGGCPNSRKRVVCNLYEGVALVFRLRKIQEWNKIALDHHLHADLTNIDLRKFMAEGAMPKQTTLEMDDVDRMCGPKLMQTRRWNDPTRR